MRKAMQRVGLCALAGGMLLAAPAAYAGDPFGMKDAANQVVNGAKANADKAAGDAKDAAMAPVKDAQAEADAAQAAAAGGAQGAVDAQKQKAVDTANEHVGKATGGMLKVQQPE